jgi:hypothetical protein
METLVKTKAGDVRLGDVEVIEESIASRGSKIGLALIVLVIVMLVVWSATQKKDGFTTIQVPRGKKGRYIHVKDQDYRDIEGSGVEAIGDDGSLAARFVDGRWDLGKMMHIGSLQLEGFRMKNMRVVVKDEDGKVIFTTSQSP